VLVIDRLTRDPARHRPGDPRSTPIEPADGAARLPYATRVLPGPTIAGTGRGPLGRAVRSTTTPAARRCVWRAS